MISYDRLITDADIDYYISFDNEQVGKLQGESLTKKLKEDGAKGSIVMINGAPTDNNAKLFKKGAHSVLDNERLQDRQGVRHARLEPRQGTAGDGAGDHGRRQGRVRRRLCRQRRHRGRRDRGDEGAGIKPEDRPTTGQDAELAAVQRILIGEQYMTVYKAIKPEAEAAAEIAVALVKGEDAAERPGQRRTIDNGRSRCPR